MFSEEHIPSRQWSGRTRICVEMKVLQTTQAVTETLTMAIQAFNA